VLGDGGGDKEEDRVIVAGVGKEEEGCGEVGRVGVD
jgi:hypothetical protein